MFNKTALFILGIFISFTTIQSQSWTQIGADIDGETAGDWSGYSVSISSDGTIVAIGAIYNPGNGTDAGHVRIYQNNSGNWIQIGNDIDGEAANDNSGCSVSLSSDGSTVAMGAWGNDGNGDDAGHVRIYQNNSGNWTQIGDDIDGEASGDFSGISVSLSSDGTIVAIGAYRNDGNGNDAGHVRIYQNMAGTWTQIGVDIDGEAENDFSGTSVSLNSNGSIVAVGARNNDGNGTDAGHVRIYQNNSGNWTQIGDDIDGEAENDNSGISICLSSDGTIVAIGAPGNDENGSLSGHVRIYQNNSGTWTQIGEDIDGETEGDRSGYSVCLNSIGTRVAVGAYGNNENGSLSGHVRIYQNNQGVWMQIDADINGEAADSYSGWSVNLNSDGTTVAVGAPVNDGNGSFSGHTRIYNNSSLIVEEQNSRNISFFPNPTKGKLNFDFANDNIQKFSIFDITGKKIIEKTEIQQNKTIDLSNLDNGIYIIKIQTDKKIFTTKIIKR